MHKFYVCLFLSLFLIACQGDKNKAPNVSDISAKVNIQRYDQALKDFDTQESKLAYLDLLADYPRLTDLYFKQLIPLFDQNQDTFYQRISSFLQDERITTLADTIKHSYPDLDGVQKELTQAVKYFKYYFTDFKEPNFYTLFTEFGYPTFIFRDQENKDGIGIGLDMFLGEEFNYKLVNPHDPAFSDYLSRTYNRDHIVKKTMEILVNDKLGDPPGKRFVDQMIHHGKRLYLLKKILPATADSIIFECTPSQMNWLVNNEKQMWNFFLEEKLMYETNQLKISKFLDPAPTTKGMPGEAPGRTATYMGYKIVQAYVKRYPELTMPDLVGIKDSQGFLTKAKYKPNRN